MAYSDNFPATRPVFMADFANGGKIDPRATFTRASTANVFDGAKHLSSENYLPYSNDLSASNWTKVRLAVDSTNNTAPDGGSDASLLLETADTGTHSFYDSFNCVSGQNYSFIFYAKPNGRTKLLFRPQATGIIASLVFDLSGSGTVTLSSGSTVSHSITQVGDYYKCQATVTAAATGAGWTQVYLDNGSGTSYAGDVTKGVIFWGHQISSTGETVLNETSGSIHRQYASSLVSKANNAARFEVGVDGQSMGVLVEGQSTNAVGYSDSLASWNQSRLTATNASAVGPTGSLNAALLTPSTDAGFEHIIYATSVTTSVTGTVTLSGYFKAAGYNYVTLGIGNTATGNFSHALFNLSTGAYVTNNSGGSNSYVSSSTESVGNGWWRLVATFSTSRSNEQFVIGPASTSSPTYDSNWGTPTYTGDGYSSVLATGIQAEVGKSFASSLITSNSGSETTRALDSLSVATADIGYTGGPFTIVSETSDGSGSYPRAWSLANADNTERVVVYRNSGTSTTSTDWYVTASSGGSAYVTSTISSSASAGKLAVSYDTNDVSFCASGGTVGTDGSAVIPSGLATIKIGSNYAGGQQLNGHCKRFAIYNEALTDTNLQALTS